MSFSDFKLRKYLLPIFGLFFLVSGVVFLVVFQEQFSENITTSCEIVNITDIEYNENTNKYNFNIEYEINKCNITKNYKYEEEKKSKIENIKNKYENEGVVCWYNPEKGVDECDAEPNGNNLVYILGTFFGFMVIGGATCCLLAIEENVIVTQE